MGRPKLESDGPKKSLHIRVEIEEHARVHYAYSLTGLPSMSEWIKPHVLAMADRVIAAAGRTVAFGRTDGPAEDGRKPEGKARAHPRAAS
jgi:hypothetical protein